MKINKIFLLQRQVPCGRLGWDSKIQGRNQTAVLTRPTDRFKKKEGPVEKNFFRLS